jgi:hypothetical protein
MLYGIAGLGFGLTIGLLIGLVVDFIKTNKNTTHKQ